MHIKKMFDPNSPVKLPDNIYNNYGATDQKFLILQSLNKAVPILSERKTVSVQETQSRLLLLRHIISKHDSIHNVLCIGYIHMKSAYWPLFSSTCLHAFLHTKQSADSHSRNIFFFKKRTGIVSCRSVIVVWNSKLLFFLEYYFN